MGVYFQLAGTGPPEAYPTLSQQITTVMGRQYKLAYTFSNVGEGLLMIHPLNILPALK